MSLYKPFGNFQNEVVDPERISTEWSEAKNIVNSTTSWQFCSQSQSGITYSELAKNGAGVRVLQKQRHGFAGAGYGANVDGDFLKTDAASAWLIPYLRGYQDVWDGDLKITWTSEEPELVLVGYSMWAYRLSSQDENKFPYTWDDDGNRTRHDGSSFFSSGHPRVRTMLGLRLDGTVIDGSGPGTNVATTGKESTLGAGSRAKGIVTSSSSVHLLPGGTHTLTPVAGQAVAAKEGAYTNSQNKLTYFSSGYSDGEAGNSTNVGVAVVNARVHVIRFPRGLMLGD